MKGIAPSRLGSAQAQFGEVVSFLFFISHLADFLPSPGIRLRGSVSPKRMGSGGRSHLFLQSQAQALFEKTGQAHARPSGLGLGLPVEEIINPKGRLHDSKLAFERFLSRLGHIGVSGSG